jgi:hypothetical protein
MINRTLHETRAYLVVVRSAHGFELPLPITSGYNPTTGRQRLQLLSEADADSLRHPVKNHHLEMIKT